MTTPTHAASAADNESTFDPHAFRRALGQFATGVTVVTYEDEDGFRGATVNSFTSVSIAPPLVLVSIARSARACRAMKEKPFTVNVLPLEGLDLAMQFAGKPTDVAVPWVSGTWAPRLAQAIAHFECEPWAEYEGGDHVLFLGRVRGYAVTAGNPLLFHGGKFRKAGPVLLNGPRVVPLDGRLVPDWVSHIHQLHEASESGLDFE